MDDNLKRRLREYIAALIGPKDMLVHVPYEITRDMLPPDMDDEKLILDAIYRCNTDGIPPREENIIQILTNAKLVDPEPAAEMVQNILDHKVFEHSASEISAFVAQIMQEWRGEESLEKAKKIMALPTLDYSAKYRRVMDVLAEAGPLRDPAMMYGPESVTQMVRREARDYAEMRKADVDAGPNLPFLAARAFIHHFRWREFSTLMAPEGTGKTSIAAMTAEYIAWTQGIDTDVVLFLLETSPSVVALRQFARHTLIPFRAIEDGLIDPDDAKYAKYFEYFDSVVLGNNRTKSGMVYICEVPYGRVEIVSRTMEKAAMASALAGRKIFFIIDYLQKLAFWDYGRMQEREVYQMAGEQWAAVTRRISNAITPAHTLLLAQEGGEKGQAFGSSVIAKVSQNVMSLSRPEPEGRVVADKPRMKDGKQLLDALGNKRYWHRKGEQFEGLGKITITKINNGRSGEIELLFENSMAMPVQNGEQIKQLLADGSLSQETVNRFNKSLSGK